MRFGAMSPREAVGGVVVHSVRDRGLVLKKGTVIGAVEVAALEAAGVAHIVVARLDPEDISEDAAAARVAAAVAGEGVHVDAAFTGRANLFAEHSGVLMIDVAAVDAINLQHEAITLATLPAYKPVVAGEMIATVKIIPFGVPAAACEAAVAAIAALGEAARMRIAPYRIRKVGIISTLLPGLAGKVVNKTLKVTAERLAPTGAVITAEQRVPHDEAELSAALRAQHEAGADMIIVFGASAIADRRDVIPAALESAGGAIEHLGMPVDPGNLMLVGRLGDKPVLGAPGCARSPKENGFDWVLTRLLAGLSVTRADIMAMGVGGLLMEIVTRPQPRIAQGEEHARVAAVILAGGQSRRMGGPNKLLAAAGDKPLVRHAAEQALASRLRPVIVVTGHQRAEVEAVLGGLEVHFVHNPDFAEGIASSVRAGIAAVPAEAEGAAVCLGDMPLVEAALLDRMADRFAPDHGALIVVPVRDGRRGNPVLWSRRFFPELMLLAGDVGARHLLERYREAVAEVAVDDEGAFLDVDTPEALGSLHQALPPSDDKG
ncbi:MAG: 4-diphosphocytidyl-2C-methyl-D-erythritol kinase [Xanthobacteraceae bacterium]|nr:MAG: 4-diphosphocytidyl-2C-methyl-D-erythritol kinase [Xanthobacteraceae bacterium]